MREIVKILEEKCDFDNLNMFNCENKIIKPIKRHLEIEWYKLGGEKIAIKFKNNKYVYKIPFDLNIMVKEKAIYDLSVKLFDTSFYLKSRRISKNCPIFYQEEVITLDSKQFKDKMQLYNIETITKELSYTLSKVKRMYNSYDIIEHAEIILWLYLSIEFYGKEKFIELFDFYNLPFFHQGLFPRNMGITKYGKPVIIDYH